MKKDPIHKEQKKTKQKKSKRLSKSTQTKIVIIGTGPSGLSAALSLHKCGFQCITLYERDEDFTSRKDGYGLTLTYNPSTTSSSSPLAKLNLLEDVARNDCPSRSHYVFNSKGIILGYYGNAFSNIGSVGTQQQQHQERGYGQRGNLRVPRQCLRRIMMDALLKQHSSGDGTTTTTTTTTVATSNENEKNIDETNSSKKEHHKVGGGRVEIIWGKKLISYEEKESSCSNEVKDNNHNVSDTSSSSLSSASEEGITSDLDKDRPITLHFQDGSTAKADLLIGADGVRSTVIQNLLSSPPDENLKTSSNHDNGGTTTTNNNNDDDTIVVSSPSPTINLSYIGVMIILGITEDFFHPLLDERGFYTLDGEHRLFTMPFEGSRLHDLELFGTPLLYHDCCDQQQKNQKYTGSTTTTNKDNTNMKRRKRRYMWQLSYKLSNEEEARDLSKGGSNILLREVQRRTKGWHKPVEEMINSTPLESIWGTPLMDRDPKAVLQRMNGLYYSTDDGSRKRKQSSLRVICMGDAVHSMSPFKGQGCNQALMDGPLLASWLERSAVNSALKGFMREMVNRTCVKVQASREAATFLHSPDVLAHRENFAGVAKDRIDHVLSELQKRQIGANIDGNLDEMVMKTIQEMGAFEDVVNNDKKTTTSDDTTLSLQEQYSTALDLASQGDTSGIRILSLRYPSSIRNAVHPETGETCLHLAARKGSSFTCRWLISEACMRFDIPDKNKRYPLHAAIVGGDLDTINLLARLSYESDICWENDSQRCSPMDLAKSHKNRQRIQELLLEIRGNLSNVM